MTDQLEEVHKKLDRILVAVWGNGTPGIKTRVDRLEQIESNRRWTMRTMFIAMSGVIVKMVHDIFRGQ